MSLKSFFLTGLTALLFLNSCTEPQNLIEGDWRAVMTIDTTRPHLELPVNFKFFEQTGGEWTATMTNAKEEIQINDILVTADSVFMLLPVFEGHIDLARQANELAGTYTHKAAGRAWSVPIIFTPGIKDRFVEDHGTPLFDPSGKWKITVNPYTDNPETQIGEFELNNGILTGTFLTTIGDYRFLEGKATGNQFMLSCFDGAHSLLFRATLAEDGSLANGIFTGGPTWKGSWIGVKDPQIQLPDPGSLTYLKPGYDQLEFSFPDTAGNMVSLNDERFKNKVKIVQIIGSWCPNCMDETRFFADLYREYHDQGLEIIALCYESENFEQSAKAIKRFARGTGAAYTFLHAGVANKKKAAQTLPMLNRILSYPTSIFIDRDNAVQNIFTGFSGPGTGEHYQKLTQEMLAAIEALLGN